MAAGRAAGKRIPGALYLENHGQHIFFCPAEAVHEEELGGGAGISGSHISFEEALSVYGEAMEARIQAFLYGSSRCCRGMEAKGKISDDFVEHFVQQFPTEHLDQALNTFRNLFFEAAHGKADGKNMIDTAWNLQRALEKAYEKLLPEEEQDIFQREHPLAWGCAEEYLEEFVSWIKQARSCLDRVCDSNLNHSRIDPVKGKKVNEYIIIGYAATKTEGLQMLADYNRNPYDTKAAKMTFDEVYEEWSKKKYPTVSKSNIKGYKASYKTCGILYNRVFKDLKLADLQQVIDTCGKN